MENCCQNSADLDLICKTQSYKIAVDGHQAHYLAAGKGPSIVLLHGGASTSKDWHSTLEALSHQYSLYAPDLIGFGQTQADMDGCYLSDLVDYAYGFIQAMNLDSTVLVGHSLGGRISLEIALRHPEMVRRLVLIDSVGFGKLARWGIALGAAAFAVRKFLGRPQPYPKFLMENGEDKDWMCLDRVPDLKMPTLIIWKERDPYYSISGAHKAKKLIPEARLEIIPGFGHAPHVNRPDLFNDLLLSFAD